MLFLYVHTAYNLGKKYLEKIGWVANVIFKGFPTLSISGKLGA